ncbi:MAG: ABC transporter permease [Sphaerotilus sulfidivorans]|jgi:capsular polysaccharide transport system permease protein|uniref:ABC transporter permease n=1 Tax=Sphaerotilus sulfidivorans TaxID=639200 RepID=UPI003F33CA0D
MLSQTRPHPVSRPRRSAWGVMRDVLFALFLRELKTRLDGRWTTALWVIGEPLAGALLMLALYTLMRTREIAGVDTVLFLLSGQLSFMLLRSLVLRLMESIDANLGLFAYRQVRPVDAVLARAGVELAIFGGMALLILPGAAWAGHGLLPHDPLGLLLALLLLTLLGLAGGLLAAVGTHGALAMLRPVLRMAFMPLYLGSGAIVPLAHLPQGLREWLLLSPLPHLIESIRIALFGPVYAAPQGIGLTLPLVWTGLATLLALALLQLRGDRLQVA